MITFSSIRELVDAANSQNARISSIALAQTALDEECGIQDAYDKMQRAYAVMRQSALDGLAPGLRSVSGLSGGGALKMKNRAKGGQSLAGPFFSEVVCSALAVSESNACMGRIVAAPTAGSSGVLPACLTALEKYHNIDEKTIVMGLINAAAVGMVIAKNASIAGASGGCQAECGSAAAMAASAMTEIMGGTPDQCAAAVAQALKSLMGLVCDPVAGLVEEPCVIRNVSAAAVAIAAAELALAGIETNIPADEVIFAMDKVGKSLPAALRETGFGGVAATPTGRAVARRMGAAAEE